RWCRREPALAALAVAMVAGFLGVATQWWRAEVHLSQVRNQHNLFIQAERRAVERLWQSYLVGARATRLSGQAGQRFDGLNLLAGAAKIPPAPAPGDEAIACLPLADLRVIRQWEEHPHADSGVAFDPRLERYARSDNDGNITVRRVADGVEALRLPAP